MPAVERALAVLEMLAASRKGLTLSEIARNLDLNRSSIYYVLRTLEQHGYIMRPSARDRYTFTPRLFTLANRSLEGLGIREKGTPFLQRLARETGLTGHLTILSQSELVILDKATPVGKGPLPTWIGKWLPVHCTAAGKALLAFQPEDVIDLCINRGLIRYNENTIVSAKRLRADLERIRIRGYSIDDEEETLGLRCVGAPVLQGSISVAAISLSGTTLEIHEENVDRLGQQVRQAADAISASLE